MSATISMNAIRELGLAPGKKAYAVIKATEVMVGRGEHLPLSARNQFSGKIVGVEKGAAVRCKIPKQTLLIRKLLLKTPVEFLKVPSTLLFIYMEE